MSEIVYLIRSGAGYHWGHSTDLVEAINVAVEMHGSVIRTDTDEVVWDAADTDIRAWADLTPEAEWQDIWNLYPQAE